MRSLLAAAIVLAGAACPMRGLAQTKFPYEILYYHMTLEGDGQIASANFEFRIRILDRSSAHAWGDDLGVVDGPYGEVDRKSIQVRQFRNSRDLSSSHEAERRTYSEHNARYADILYSEDREISFRPSTAIVTGDELLVSWRCAYTSSLGWPTLRFSGNVPMLETDYRIRVPAALDLSYFTNGMPGPAPQVTTEGLWKEYRFAAGHAGGFVPITGGAGAGRDTPYWELQPREWVLGATIVRSPDWAGLGKAFADYAGTSWVPGDAIRDEAAKVVGDAKDIRGKVDRLFAHVRDRVRYSAVYLGQGGYQPVACGKVATDLKGDCKGMAVLLSALLNSAGVESGVALVLTADEGVVDPSVASLRQFNHMIAWATVDGNLVFLDATDKYGSPWSPPWRDRLNPLLVIRPAGGSFLHQPAIPLAEESIHRIAGIIRPAGTETYSIEVQHQFKGGAGIKMAEAWKAIAGAERDAWIRGLAMDIFPSAQVVRAGSKWDQTAETFVAAFELLLPESELILGGKRLPLFPWARGQGINIPPLADTGQTAVLGTPHVIEEEWLFDVPGTWTIPDRQGPADGPAMLDAECRAWRDQDGTIRTQLRIAQSACLLKADAVEAFRKEVSHALRAAKAVARLGTGGTP